MQIPTHPNQIAEKDVSIVKYSLWTRSVSLLLAVLMVLAIPAAAVEVPESQADGASTAAEGGTDAVQQDPFDSSADTVLPAQDGQEDAGSVDETEDPAQETEAPKEPDAPQVTEPQQEPEAPQVTEPQQEPDAPQVTEPQQEPETPAAEETPVYLDQEGSYLAPEQLVLTLISFADGESANNRTLEQYTGIVAFYDYNERDTEKMLEHPYFFYYEKGVLQDEEERFSRADRYMSLASAPTKTTDGEGAEQLVYLAEEVYVDPEAETHPDYLFAFNQADGDNGLYTGGVDGVAYTGGQTTVIKLTGLTQDAVNANRPTITWEHVDVDGVVYQIWRSTDGGSTWTMVGVDMGGLDGGFYTDHNATQAGTTYTYCVCAVYRDGSVTERGVSVLSYTFHADLSNVKAVAAAGGVRISWSADNAATGYRVLRRVSDTQDSVDSAKWTEIADLSGSQSVQWLDSTASSNVTYSYGVRAYYGAKEGDSREAYTAPVWNCAAHDFEVYYLAAPKLTNVYSTASGMTVTWSAVAGATKYNVYQKEAASGATWRQKGTVSASTRSLTISDVTAGSGYYYTVRAVNAEGQLSPYFDDSGDASKQITYHGTPAVALKNGDGVVVSWSKDAAATGYRVYRQRAGTSGWSVVANVTSGKTTSYADTTAASGTSYVYTVRAYYGSVSNISKDVSYSSNRWSGYKASAALLYVAPAKLSRVYTSANGMTLTWNEVPKATGYWICVRQPSTTKWTRLALVNGGKTTTYIDKKAVAGTSYIYTVVAVIQDSAGTEHKAGYFSAPAATCHVSPVITLATGSKGIGLAWTQDKAATGYRVLRKAGNGSWETFANVTAASLAGKTSGAYLMDSSAKLKSGTVYSYAVRAYYGDVSKLSSAALDYSNLWSYFQTKSITYLATPVLKSTTTTEKGIKVSWSKVAGAAGYRVYRRAASSNSWSQVGTISNGTTEVFVDTSKMNAGASYYYNVRAVGSDKTSLSYFHTTGIYAIYLPAPELVSAVVSSSGTLVKWNAVKGADGYRIYRRGDTGNWTLLSTIVGGSNLSFRDTAVKSDSATYYYTVRAYKTVTVSGKQTTLLGSFHSTGITFSIPMSGSGWVKKNGNTYYVKNGYCLTGWQYLSRNGGNYKYYFDIKTGALVTNLYSYFGKSCRNLKCRIVVCLNSSDSNPSYNTIYLYDSATDSYCIPAVSIRCVGNLSKTMYSNSSNVAFLKAGTGQRWLDSGSYEQYACYISGTYSWFHSALYFGSKSPNSFSSSSYNSMVNNNNNSNGCVRMQCIYAFLIQDIMKNGYGKSNRVNVILRKRTSEAGPFGVPKVDKISSRKTDPTDPAVTGKFFYETSLWGVSAKAGASAWTSY